MTELADLGRWNDELMTAKDADLTLIRDLVHLDNQLKKYKHRYELAKTKLRSVKGRPSFLVISVRIRIPSFPATY